MRNSTPNSEGLLPPDNYEEILNNLKEQHTFYEKDGLFRCEKRPLDYTPGFFDKRVGMERGRPRKTCTLKDSFVYKGIPIGEIRATDGWDNFDISQNVCTEILEVPFENRTVSVEFYVKDVCGIGKPLLIFMHGGGFVSGSVDVVRNFCKGLVDSGDIAVANIDYSLAPEAKYPIAIEEGITVIRYFAEHAKQYGIDPKYIGVAGDSAGGNLVGAIAILEELVTYQCLIYPLVVVDEREEEKYCTWSRRQYDIDADEKLVDAAIAYIKDAIPNVRFTYTDEDTDLSQKTISLICNDRMEHLPRTLIVASEFDYLRVQDEAYARMLCDAGAQVKYIEYKGMDHAFIDKTGYYPQAEDCIYMIREDFLADRKKAIIFDLDGVLCFTDRYHYQAWKKLADELGILFDEKSNERFRGVSRMDCLDMLLADGERFLTDEEKEELAARKNEYYKELLKNMSPGDLKEEDRQALEKLRIQGYLLAVGSSSKNTPIILERLGLGAFFDAVVDGNDIKHSKPDPEVFLKAAEKLGVRPSECIVVEDAKAGIDAAKAGGMYAIGIGPANEYEKADRGITKLSDLAGH